MMRAIDELRRELVESRSLGASLRALVQSLEGKVSALESSLVTYAAENELLKRKLLGTKSERTNTSEFQLVIASVFPENTALKKEIEEALAPGDANTPDGNDGGNSDEAEKKRRAKPKGRRNLSRSTLPRITVDVEDAALAEQGRVMKWEESFQLIHVRGGFHVLVKRTAVYEIEVAGTKTVLCAQQPRTLFPRALCHTSVFAWLAVQKFSLGVPCHRLEQHLECEEESLDRGTMCRYLEDLGATLGATVVHAMLDDARANCNVLSTDATGAAIQPEPSTSGHRQACKKGHFFTIVADRDHVLFHYTESHSSDAVKELFSGFSGYLQSDASSVYDILERRASSDADDASSGLRLVGCWAHCRRYFFEAAVTKHRTAVEGLKRIRELYRVEAKFAKLPPSERKKRRAVLLAPLIDDFFQWVRAAKLTEVGRTLATKALGYALNQESELRRVLEDGRLPLDNTRSERSLRRIVVGRKNWLFYGSDIHAQSAAALFSIIASCRLHQLDPLEYLSELLRVLPYWPRERYIELAPKNWAATRAALSAAELSKPVGVITVPPGE